jgi:AcrR family transcriptional regulator
MITLAQQRERRRRIIDVTLGIARGGGYEAVKMRAVAERADVALATLYRYFPSKPNLLLSVLECELDGVERTVGPVAPGAADRYERLWVMIAGLNAEMARDPRLAEAMARTFMAAYTANAVTRTVCAIGSTSCSRGYSPVGNRPRWNDTWPG